MKLPTILPYFAPLTSPVMDVVQPLYYLATGHERKKQVENLLLTAFRIATFVGFFFLVIPFNKMFGSQGNLSASLAMGSQWMIHPYAAAQFNAAIAGGIFLLMQASDMISKRKLNLTREHAGPAALTCGFLYLAHLIKKHAIKDHPVDQKYQEWSQKLVHKICH